jgi:hypothetical protein
MMITFSKWEIYYSIISSLLPWEMNFHKVYRNPATARGRDSNIIISKDDRFLVHSAIIQSRNPVSAPSEFPMLPPPAEVHPFL